MTKYATPGQCLVVANAMYLKEEGMHGKFMNWFHRTVTLDEARIIVRLLHHLVHADRYHHDKIGRFIEATRLIEAHGWALPALPKTYDDTF